MILSLNYITVYTAYTEICVLLDEAMPQEEGGFLGNPKFPTVYVGCIAWCIVCVGCNVNGLRSVGVVVCGGCGVWELRCVGIVA